MAKKKEEITVRSSTAEYLTYVASVGDIETSVEMRYEDENIWLTQKLMAARPTTQTTIRWSWRKRQRQRKSARKNNRIVQGMLPFLNNEQLRQLQRVLERQGGDAYGSLLYGSGL